MVTRLPFQAFTHARACVTRQGRLQVHESERKQNEPVSSFRLLCDSRDVEFGTSDNLSVGPSRTLAAQGFLDPCCMRLAFPAVPKHSSNSTLASLISLKHDMRCGGSIGGKRGEFAAGKPKF